MGNVQRIRLTEGQDASRPFQRFRPSRLDVETIIAVQDASDRPYQAGYLVWLQVEVGTAAAATWFRGLMLTPDYRMQRQGRSRVRFSALDLSDALNEEITVANQSANTIAENFGLLLNGVGWPDDADWRDIDADLIEQLSAWEHASGRAITSAQALVDTVGPPARMVIRRNGGMRVIKDVSDTVEASFTDADVRELPDLQQHEDSVINTVTIEGTTLGSIASTVRNRRPLEYDVLDGLAAVERVNVIRRILRAYENGLTTLDLDFHADDDRNQASVAALEPGQVIELQSDFLGQTFAGPVSGLRWRWEGVRAFVRANVVVQTPAPELVGARIYALFGTGAPIEDDRLFIVDIQTGLATAVDVGDPIANSALAYDLNNDILYGATTSIYRINVTTGVGTEIVNIGTTVTGLAYDTDTDTLYGVSPSQLYSIPVDGSALSVIGPFNLGFSFVPNLRSLAYFPSTGQLIGTNSSRRLISIDPVTGLGTDRGLVGANIETNGVRIGALAYDVGNQTFVAGEAIGGGNDVRLFRMGLLGNLTQIGTTLNLGLPVGTSGGDIVGLAYMRLPDPTQLSAPTGLALTESGGDITAAWNAVTDATGYVLEWREEGSGDAWQEVDVTTPPHTFTP